MYSPKIDETLVPPLYWLARSRGQPMTRLVSGVLATYLARRGLLPEVARPLLRGRKRRRSSPRVRVIPDVAGRFSPMRAA